MKINKIKAAKTSSFEKNKYKHVKLEDREILISKVEGQYYAVGAFCTHYGAPLSEGFMHDDRFVCPWHHACFNAKTGNLEEPPARDALPVYKVAVEGDEIYVYLPDEVAESRTPSMIKKDFSSDNRTFVILGAGAAGNAGAQSLRENGFKGRIIMVSQEDRLPYDRPNLSKEYLKGEAEQEWMPLRPPSFFEQHEIELWKKKKVTRVNTSESRLDFEDNDSLKYDKILIATGSIPRRPDIAGINLKHIFTLRSFDDSDEIIAAAKSVKNVVILGASFIATETADSLRHRGLSVTLVAPESVPFEKVLGKEIGNMFLKAHRERGVDFRLGQKVAKFQGNNRVESVILENGDTIQADLVIIGAGVKPATHLLKDVDLLSDGSVKVNEYFSISENAYAAGDIATFPYWLTGSDIRIEHWRTAEQQGRIAGANMAGKKVKYLGVPFFWTTQAGLNFRYVGYATEWDKIIVQGNVIKKVFIAFFVKGENIHAIAGVNQDKEMAKYEELMRNQKLPPLHEL